MTDSDKKLTAHGVAKRFGANQVLFDVDFALRAGEVHALVGENGAGKSTLMKILAGFEKATSGELLLDGDAVVFASGEMAENRGVVMIHQEFNLAERLSVEANIFLGRELRRGPFVDVAAMRKRAETLMADLDCAVDATARVADLSVSDKQLVEIAKALSRDVSVLIMDEPTAVLTESESQALFTLIDRLRQRGVAILFTSHKLGEVCRIADRVTVLRDGRVVTTRDKTPTEDEMATLMVGRELSDLFPARAPTPAQGTPVLEVEGFCVPGLVDNASFALYKGEVLGVAGLIGAGRTELMEAVVGLRRRSAGRLRRDGQPVEIRSPRQAAAKGIAYLTEDRKGHGLLLDKPLAENLMLFQFASSGRFLINKAAEQRSLRSSIAEFDIRVPNESMPVSNLSGGNQQKLLFAKTMLPTPDIIIIDEPTRGIDIGTKQQIYALIQRLAAEGKSCIVISSEMSEIIGLSHRVLVMRRGRINGELAGSAIREESIMRHAAGLEDEAQRVPA